MEGVAERSGKEEGNQAAQNYRGLPETPQAVQSAPEDPGSATRLWTWKREELQHFKKMQQAQRARGWSGCGLDRGAWLVENAKGQIEKLCGI